MFKFCITISDFGWVAGVMRNKAKISPSWVLDGTDLGKNRLSQIQCNTNIFKDLNTRHQILDIRIRILNFLVMFIFDIGIQQAMEKFYVLE